MHIDLSGRSALVTGSTAGIGYAAALGLAGCGARVIVNGRQDASVQAACAAIRNAVPGAEVDGIAADVGTAEGCDVLLAALPSVDVLVNNVGIYGLQDFFELPDEEWRRFFEINVLSAVRLARAYVPAMAGRGWGRVVFLSSESGLNIPADMIHYGFTKTALLSVSRGLAKRMAGSGVTVNAVLPGPTRTEGVEALLQAEVERSGRTLEEVGCDFIAAHRPSSILRRLASAEEVANLIIYACSPQASATTGAALRVDGGVVDTIA